jgi:transcriptional regulator GlxA family with amidase domain
LLVTAVYRAESTCHDEALTHGDNESVLILDEGHGMKVAIVIFDGVQALDVAGPLDVFAEANTYLSDHQRYEVSLVGSQAGTVTCSNGMQLSVPFGYADLDIQYDLILVTGGPQLPDSQPSSEFLKWLQSQARGATRFGSVCNGTFLLGHAGLIDGKEVTTHWADAVRLADEFPLACVQLDRIFIRDGRLFTSAGVTAGIDLCLSLVSEDWGHEMAVRVAKRLVVYIQREGGQSQYSPFIGAGKDEDPIVGKVHRYVTEHITDALSIEQLASAVSVSRRTFSRLFAKYAKVTPSAFVEQVRVDTARKLLEGSDAPLKTVAFKCGFHSATHMRMTFSRRLNVTPNQYRQRFRGTVGPLPLAYGGADKQVSSQGLLHP